MKRFRATINLFCSSIAVLLGSATSLSAEQPYEVRYSDLGEGHRQIISEGPAEGRHVTDLDQPFSEESFPRYVIEHQPPSEEKIVVLRSSDKKTLTDELKRRGVTTNVVSESSADFEDEVVTLVDSGPSSNRIDVVFMGDGYTSEERQKFFDDMNRMVDDMFRDQTFNSYLPLFNVHAVFRPSNESGIGKNDRAKDTAYRLYRAGNTLRAIYPSNARALRDSCSQAPGCDYPVVIANDPFYGGLGGEFAVSTSSPTSGTVVLRHELGHNFGRVGEEYDGGGYFGANHSRSLSSLSWKHWATDDLVRAEPSKSRFIDWPWKNLKDGPYKANFSSDGSYAHWSMRISASGFEEEGSLEITHNEDPINFQSPGTNDRSFHTYSYAEGLEEGDHSISFRETINDGNNWMSSINIQEYKEDYHFEDDYIGAYPLYTKSGRVSGYRSNHETCLMRNMESPIFCSICQENNWMNFFAKVKLIDSLEKSGNLNEGDVGATLTTQSLGQFRSPRTLADDGSKVAIKWFKDGVEVKELENKSSWTLPKAEGSGSWKVKATFVTPEVRKDSKNLLSDQASLTL